MKPAITAILLAIAGHAHAQQDAFAFSYRGMHLDVARHFFPKEVIYRYLDTLAVYGISHFHWHLTDDQGWRIEIKKYPRLTSIGAYRREPDGSTYGGYYTQQDVRDIVNYAAAKGITVVPEIDLPGHASAAIAAYPFLSCHGRQIEVPARWGIFRDIICPTDTAIRFFQDVLDEVLTLFPSPYIHLGGDEVPKHQWRQSDFVKQLMKKNNIKYYRGVQRYFTEQLERYVESKGRRCILWGEAVRGGASPRSIIMSWRDKYAGIRAARKGNEVIMAPRFYCYFDYPQYFSEKKPAFWMTYLTWRKVARFTPHSVWLTKRQNEKIIGAEATLWTEYVPDEKKLWHQLLPRLKYFSEALKKDR
ncbi:MAG: family 20 glycosylhydrolase [Chitinophagales bacterium]|nr:family 20 glycosylhydrolase [Chitinophagales bacterium]MDW8419320.1 family 20 glycosylhydrolase [Chitinophagales bacterium]